MASETVTIPARRGKAALVAPGRHIKVINTHGQQVVDAWAFNAADVSEYMSMEHSRPYFMKLRPQESDTFVTNRRRPILTLVEDRASGVHDTLMAACDQTRYKLLGHMGYHENCADNLRVAMAELGFDELPVPSPLNLFMNIPWTEGGELSWREPVTKPGDYVVLRAEMSLVIAFSACPQDILPINGRTGKPTEAHFEVL